MIETHGLTKQFRKFKAVDDLTLTIKSGEIFGLIGPNGAGKTTTLRMLTGLISPTSGEAVIDGISTTTRRDEIRKKIGLLTETPQLVEDLTGRDNLRYIAGFYDTPRDIIDQRIHDLSERLGMTKHLDKPAESYSKGMKQKTAIIRCLLHDPSVLFLDEPTSGLDPASSQRIKEIIHELKAEGKTIILCTHNLYDAARLCDNIGIINHRLLYYGSPRNIPGTGKVEVCIPNLTTLPRLVETLGVNGYTAEQTADDSITATIEGDKIPAMVARIVNQGGEVRSVSDTKYALEDLYTRLLTVEETP